MAYHEPAIPTPAVWRQQLRSGEEVVHLEPPALQTSAVLVLFSPRGTQSTDGTVCLRVPSPSLVLSLPALTAVAVLSLPDYSGGDPGSGDKQIYISQRSVPPLPSGVNLFHTIIDSLYLMWFNTKEKSLTHVSFEGACEAAKFVS